MVFLSLLSFGAKAYVPEAEVGTQNQLPEAIEGVGIEEKLNENLPSHVILTDDRGNKVKLANFYNYKRPILLSLVYFSCPSLCNLHLDGVFGAFRELGLKPGEDFEYLAVTIDPKEDRKLAAAKKQNYISNFLENFSGKGIHFLTGNSENISELARAVGFKYKWNPELQEWSHASAVIVNTPQGRISRYLHGVFFDPKTFRLSVVEASKGKVGSFADNFALFCFRYNEKINKYSFYILNVLRMLAALVLFFLLLWLVPFWLRLKKDTG